MQACSSCRSATSVTCRSRGWAPSASGSCACRRRSGSSTTRRSRTRSLLDQLHRRVRRRARRSSRVDERRGRGIDRRALHEQPGAARVQHAAGLLEPVHANAAQCSLDAGPVRHHAAAPADVRATARDPDHAGRRAPAPRSGSHIGCVPAVGRRQRRHRVRTGSSARQPARRSAAGSIPRDACRIAHHRDRQRGQPRSGVAAARRSVGDRSRQARDLLFYVEYRFA